jgi:hypothetical protein
VYVKGERFAPEHLSTALSNTSLLTATAMPVSVLLQFCLITTLMPTLISIVSWALLMAAMTVPYVFAGITVTLALTRSPFPVSLVYAVDLLGAAFGCAAVVGILNVFDGPTAILLVALTSAGAAWAFARGATAPERAVLASQGRLRRPLVTMIVLAVLVPQFLFARHRVSNPGGALSRPLAWFSGPNRAAVRGPAARRAASRSEDGLEQLLGVAEKRTTGVGGHIRQSARQCFEPRHYYRAGPMSRDQQLQHGRATALAINDDAVRGGCVHDVPHSIQGFVSGTGCEMLQEATDDSNTASLFRFARAHDTVTGDRACPGHRDRGRRERHHRSGAAGRDGRGREPGTDREDSHRCDRRPGSIQGD